MPTYEYKREDGTTFEITQSINDDPLKKCPETGLAVRRIISGGSGVLYKGDGWYVTDYKNGGRNKNGKNDTTPQKSEKKSGNSENSNSENKSN